MTWEINEDCGKDIIVRLNNDEGVKEIELFRDNFKLSTNYYTIQEVADSLVYIYKSWDRELEDDDIEIVEQELDKVNELIYEAYEWLEYEENEQCC
ncbi:hypothetical protein [Clostridium sp.]|uniref:hypothetical protein n=1 Tax=Clostridium sp. TaxID=1506 RepID=UPI00399511AE